LTVLILDAGTVLDFLRVGGSQHKDDVATSGTCQRAEVPLQLGLPAAGLRDGSDVTDVAGQRVAQENVMSSGLRAVFDTQVVLKLLPRRSAGHDAHTDHDDRHGWILGLLPLKNRHGQR